MTEAIHFRVLAALVCLALITRLCNRAGRTYRRSLCCGRFR